jgi:hypothetical protein
MIKLFRKLAIHAGDYADSAARHLQDAEGTGAICDNNF